MAGIKECYAAVRVKKRAMLHKWNKRVLCCLAREKERYAAVPVKNNSMLPCR